MIKKIEKIISKKIRPSIQEHGGDIEIVSFQDGIFPVYDADLNKYALEILNKQTK
jgi:hypothetical protein